MRLDGDALEHKLINSLLTILGLFTVSASRDSSDETGGLRRFGLALALDDRFTPDEASAARLVDKLVRQSRVLALESEPAGVDARTRGYFRFIQLYRRHVRRLAQEDDAAGWNDAPGPGRPSAAVGAGVRALPLELREALLLVVLAGFSHAGAAAALDIPLSHLIERLDRARARLAEHMGLATATRTSWRGPSHLRIIK